MRTGFLVGAAFILGLVAGVFLVAPMVHYQPQQSAPAARPVAQQPPPQDPFELNRLKGNQAMDAGQFEEAVAAYERALSIRFDADAATDRGICLRQLGRRDQALAAFEFVTLKDPSHWKARYNRTAMLLEAGRFDEAKASFAILEKLDADEEAMRTLRDALSGAR